jgi:hypothetical protein
MGRRYTLVLGCLLLATVAGCSRTAPAPKLGYLGDAPIILSVAQLDVEDRRQPLAQANFIDERRSDALSQEVQSYLRARFAAGSGAGSAVAVIEQANIVERLIEGRSGGVIGAVTGEPTYGLDGTLAVRIIARDVAGNEVGYARASVARSRSIRAGTTVLERDAEAKALMTELINQLDPALVQAVRENLRSGPV